MAMFGAPRKPFDPSIFAVPGTPPIAPPMGGINPVAQMPANPMLGTGSMTPSQNTPPTPASPGGYNAPGGWADKLGSIGALLMASGGNPAGQTMLGMIEQRRQANQARYAPQHVGNSIIHLDPTTGKYVVDWAKPDDGPDGGPIAKEIADLRAAGATDADIHAFVQSKTDPAQIVSIGNGQYQAVRHSQMYNAPQPAPPGVTFTPIPAPGGAGSGQRPFRHGS